MGKGVNHLLVNLLESFLINLRCVNPTVSFESQNVSTEIVSISLYLLTVGIISLEQKESLEKKALVPWTVM